MTRVTVLLVHGMGRSPVSMMNLGRRLRRAGFRTRYFAYVPAFESFAGIAGRLRQTLSRCRPQLVIGHSLGGLLLRKALSEIPESLRPRHLVMLGTPTRSPRLARVFQRNWLFRLATGDCGQLLASPERMSLIPPPCISATLILGTRSSWPTWHWFGEEPNDGIVARNEAVLDGVPVIERPWMHSFLMDDPEVASIIRKY